MKLTDEMLDAMIHLAEEEIKHQDEEGYRGSYFVNECRLAAYRELKQYRQKDKVKCNQPD